MKRDDVIRCSPQPKALLLNQLTRIDGVTGVHSSFVLRQVVVKTAVPVASGSD